MTWTNQGHHEKFSTMPLSNKLKTSKDKDARQMYTFSKHHLSSNGSCLRKLPDESALPCAFAMPGISRNFHFTSGLQVSLKKYLWRTPGRSSRRDCSRSWRGRSRSWRGLLLAWKPGKAPGEAPLTVDRPAGGVLSIRRASLARSSLSAAAAAASFEPESERRGPRRGSEGKGLAPSSLRGGYVAILDPQDKKIHAYCEERTGLYVRTDGHTLSEKRNYQTAQVTNSMFGASRKKFVEGVDSDYHDENMYYSQSSVFSHRSEKDLLASPSPSGQLSQFGASLYGQQSALGLPVRRMSNNTPQLNRSLSQGTQLPSHVTPTTGVPTMSLHMPPSPSRGILPMNLRSMMNHSQVGQGIGIPSRTNSMSSSELGSPNRSSPSIIYMPKQQPSRQPFTVKSMSGFGMNRNQAFGMNNFLSSNIFNGTDGSENVTGLDLSDFPALADGNRREGNSNPTPLINHLAGRAPYVGMVTKPANEQSQDFSIHNEDFPALPGSSYKDPMSSNDDSKSNLSTSEKTTTSTDGPKFHGDKSSTTQNNNQQKKGIQVLPDGRVTNIPQGMVMDQFGMIGLLTFIRAAETDPGMVHLALGSDLTTLGLNLNSSENPYPKFASPWASSPCRPQDIDFHVPSEYLTNIHIRDKLAAIKLGRYGEDLLFYLYYMNSGDVLQLLAAVELFNRDWRYHKEERVWITRTPGMEPTMKTNTYERGTYYFFDCLNWRKVAKEFHLEYDKLEERPHLPSTFNYNPAQQAF
ncbi:LOW QUALITY PROTEIN: CCR4-NOT transcription complex subunit 2-like [Mus pahari]|uniref:LOW QUALITY PROTEIN: CCR4-NOT transcription complex subunit 2-like n=1 Tax=Mus pahari TaxID=10093 RepID=UPI001114FA3D|nr:LOW QUALITY PROTEIN: CCR4-NOT transcription complex subunit 2-like [Mus pahari]